MAYLVSETTKTKLDQLIARNDSTMGGTGKGAGSRLVCHVLITGAADGAGFYPCLPVAYNVSSDAFDAFSSAKVFEPNGTALVVGDFYLAVRYGLDADGVGIFATSEGDSGDSSSSAFADYLDYETSITWVNTFGSFPTGVQMFLPEAGTYMIYKQPFWQINNNTATSNRLDAVDTWLWDANKGGADYSFSSPGTIPMSFCYDCSCNFYTTTGISVEAFGTRAPVTLLYYVDKPTIIKLIQYHGGGGGSPSGYTYDVYLLFAYMWWVKLGNQHLPGTTA